MELDQSRGDALHRSGLAKVANFLLGDIDKDTVDFQPNYERVRTRVQVLPARRTSSWRGRNRGRHGDQYPAT